MVDLSSAFGNRRSVQKSNWDAPIFEVAFWSNGMAGKLVGPSVQLPRNVNDFKEEELIDIDVERVGNWRTG